MGRTSRDKGARIEREIVEQHKLIGIHAERYPLSGASRSVAAVTISTSTRLAKRRPRSSPSARRARTAPDSRS
jgi:hypothetical protein